MEQSLCFKGPADLGVGLFPYGGESELWSSFFDNPASTVPMMTQRCAQQWCRDSETGKAPLTQGTTAKREPMGFSCPISDFMQLLIKNTR